MLNDTIYGIASSSIEIETVYCGLEADQPAGMIWVDDVSLISYSDYDGSVGGWLSDQLMNLTNSVSFWNTIINTPRDKGVIRRLYYQPEFWDAYYETEYGISDFRFRLASELGWEYGEPIYQLDFYVHFWEPGNLNASKKQVHIVWGEYCGILWDYSIIPEDFENVDVEGMVYEAKNNADSAISTVNYLSDNVYTKTEINNKLSGLPKIVQLTQSEYDALAKKDSNTLYIII